MLDNIVELSRMVELENFVRSRKYLLSVDSEICMIKKTPSLAELS